MKTNADYQRSFKKRMRDNGFKQITIWVAPEDLEAVKKFNKGGKPAVPVQPSNLHAVDSD